MCSDFQNLQSDIQCSTLQTPLQYSSWKLETINKLTTNNEGKVFSFTFWKSSCCAHKPAENVFIIEGSFIRKQWKSTSPAVFMNLYFPLNQWLWKLSCWTCCCCNWSLGHPNWICNPAPDFLGFKLANMVYCTIVFLKMIGRVFSKAISRVDRTYSKGNFVFGVGIKGSACRI